MHIREGGGEEAWYRARKGVAECDRIENTSWKRREHDYGCHSCSYYHTGLQ